jgi:hypothetical protein
MYGTYFFGAEADLFGNGAGNISHPVLVAGSVRIFDPNYGSERF